MSRSKPDKVFAIRDDEYRVHAHVIARHGKGALTIARGLVADLPRSAEAHETTPEMAGRAINARKSEA